MKKELETLIQAVGIYSNDIKMNFRTYYNYRIKTIRTLRKQETYKYLGILEADTIKQAVRKEKNVFKYLRRTRNQLEIKLHSRILIKAIITQLYPRKIPGTILRWTRQLQQIDQRIRKLMSIHKTLRSRDGVDRQYMSRNERRRGFAGVHDGVDASIQWIKAFIKNGEKDWLQRPDTILITQPSTEQK